ncbi:MAG: hypothetical protein CTY38_00745 [Methylotenera sp.]|uniref:hypothetical protein n=1 Tax=Methylotenera sp. TaxID=2051956 RepID=UPI000D497348|nr:hypothetical protein [Methylotenera sp.]PPC84606.1 MAG: hypothetical protein CTY38_00745 [Methylotenera sp.]
MPTLIVITFSIIIFTLALIALIIFFGAIALLVAYVLDLESLDNWLNASAEGKIYVKQSPS